MKADMTASRVSVELLLYLIYYGLSQGLRLEDGTYSSTLLAYINRPLWNWRDKAKKESYTYLGQNRRHLYEQKHVPLKAWQEQRLWQLAQSRTHRWMLSIKDWFL